MSTRTVVYKGLLMAEPGRPLLPDLAVRASNRHRAGAPALLDHSCRQLGAGTPVPDIAHNGEINTRPVHFNWIRAREGL